MLIKYFAFSIILFVLFSFPLVNSKGINPDDVDKIEVVYASSGVIYNDYEEKDFIFGVVKLIKPDESIAYSIFLEIDGFTMLDYKGSFGYYCNKIIENEVETIECDKDEFGFSLFREGVWKFRQIKGFVYDDYNPYYTADAEVDLVFTKEGRLDVSKSSILIPNHNNKHTDYPSIECYSTTIFDGERIIEVIDPKGNPVISCESICYSYVRTDKIEVDGKEYDDRVYDKNSDCNEYGIIISKEFPFSTMHLEKTVQ